MNERLDALRTYLLDKKHHAFVRTSAEAGIADLNEQFEREGTPDQMRSAIVFREMMRCQEPVILPGEKIVLTRTVKDVPFIYTDKEWEGIKSTHYIHERGTVSNISPDYETTVRLGLGARRKEVEARLEDESLDVKGRTFLKSVLICIEALQDLISRYEAKAREAGEDDTAEVLSRIRTEGAGSFREALQLLRAIHFAIWAADNYHNTLGRFEQYMCPYFRHDIDNGVLTREEAFDLLEEFFLTCNKDSDFYPGMQQGDNGQSIVLGGRDAEGNYLFNELSEMCLKASYELRLIDPKINIRVDSRTPDEVFEKGSRLTKIGLGFPQYSNDDVVIQGLIRKGYSEEDARDYVVAACWEFIIPKVAMDIVNIDGLSLAACVKDSLPALKDCKDYEEFYCEVERNIFKEADRICSGHKDLYMIPSPMMSLLMDGTIEKARDISLGCKYNNFGIHGTGLATAADSLAAIKKFFFEQKRFTYDRLLEALEKDFRNDPELKDMLRKEAPKMGQDDDEVDAIGTALLDSFDKALEGRVNERGGIYRAGTGTAMYYIWHARDLGATPDGRTAEENIPANYSPSLFMKQNGPVSVIKSFSKPHLERVINGGPLTLEFDRTVFRNDESIRKLGMLVKTFVTLGGHQLQLNTVSREELLDAKVHPEAHRQLIVRVWGWSGYFVELDECYQDHVISRIEFDV
ncbi:MAG: pyruvate formate-lyase [Bacteroidales bacterium]|nr:pyruvate formate-lyase [Bacteroidales bacterium]